MKYIITTVQYGARVNKNLLANMKLFAQEHGVDHIYTFVMNGRYKDEDFLDPAIGVDIATVDNLRLNSNLRLQDVKILAQQINPFTGMNQKLSRDYSYILPSPKIRYESVANTSQSPRAFMTTGALTHGNYKMHTAQGRKANEQHQYGFVYVEVKNNKIFHAYQVEATKGGDFYYMREKYHKGKKLTRNPEALVLGDWHTGDTNPKIRKRTIEMIKELKPKRVVFHDFFNGHSINPHEKGHLITSLKSFQRKRDSLDRELKEVYKEMQFFATEFPEIQFLVPESNHDIFLYRYLDSKGFIEHAQNFMFALRMIPEVLEDKKPTLEVGLGLMGEIPSNFKFLREDEEHRVRGVELGYHGHRGANGSRGTSRQFQYLNLKMISGHEHSPKLYANSMVVGTSTKLKLDYTKGASSWMHAHGILYEDGKYGLITLI
jgi:hypothetical protein